MVPSGSEESSKLARLNKLILQAERRLQSIEAEIEEKEKLLEERRRELAAIGVRITAKKKQSAGKSRPIKLCFRVWPNGYRVKQVNAILNIVKACLSEAHEMEPDYRVSPKIHDYDISDGYVLFNVELPRGMKNLFLNILTQALKKVGRLDV